MGELRKSQQHNANIRHSKVHATIPGTHYDTTLAGYGVYIMRPRRVVIVGQPERVGLMRKECDQNEESGIEKARVTLKMEEVGYRVVQENPRLRPVEICVVTVTFSWLRFFHTLSLYQPLSTCHHQHAF